LRPFGPPRQTILRLGRTLLPSRQRLQTSRQTLADRRIIAFVCLTLTNAARLAPGPEQPLGETRLSEPAAAAKLFDFVRNLAIFDERYYVNDRGPR